MDQKQNRNKLHPMHKSLSDIKINESFQGDSIGDLRASTLSKSLGAKGFFNAEEEGDGDDHYADAEEDDKKSLTGSEKDNQSVSSENIYVNSAISIPYGNIPPSSKYIR